MSIRQGYKQTDTEEIPEEWAIRKLGDERVTQLMKAGGTPLRTRKEYYENGTIPFVRIEDITTAGKYLNKTELKITEKGLNNSSTWLVPKKSILYSMYASYGEAVINTIPVATNQAIIAILCSENVELEYLYYSLSQIKTSLYKYLRTTTQKNLNAKIVKNLKIPIPPLVEQQSIARILSCVDEAIQKTEEVIERTEMLKRGLMQRLFTRGIEHTRFKQTELGDVPEEWEIVPLNEVVNDIRYGTSVKSNNDTKGLPVLRIPNIIGGKVTLDDLKWVELSKSEIHALLLEEGDLLIVRTNANPDYIGRSAQFKNQEGNWVFASYLIRIRPNRHKIDSDFLNLFLHSDAVRRRFRRIARTSAGNYNINTQNLRAVKIALPCLDEQQMIAKILSQTDSKIEVEKGELRDLQALKAGLMQVLLTGKVRVKVG